MKLHKYFSHKEMKEICNALNANMCYYRYPKSHFIKVLGEDTFNKLVEMKYLLDSPKLDYYWDYKVPCCEFSTKFRRIFNWYTTPFKLYIKYYVFNYGWFKSKWQQFRILCCHHYDWQDYEGIDVL